MPDAKNASSETDENGRPYDGKIFILTGEQCPDGTRVRGRIVLKDNSSADLFRYECQEINPVALGPSDFKFNPNNSEEIEYKNQIFTNTLVGTKFNMSLVRPELGFCFMMAFEFGTPPDTAENYGQSNLQIYEDGKPLGPGHSWHVDIREIGLGRFSHKLSDQQSVLRFSASDNSNPMTNGRTYTWEIKN